MSTSLWPDFTTVSPPRGMSEMLYDAAGDIGTQTNGAIDFYVDTVGVGPGGSVKHLRYNCYLRVAKKDYSHLFFRVTAPVDSAFPADAGTPEDDHYPDLKDEGELRDAIAKILQRERTKEVVFFLKNIAG